MNLPPRTIPGKPLVPGPITVTPTPPGSTPPQPPSPPDQGPPIVGGDPGNVPVPPRARIAQGLISCHGIGDGQVALVIALPDNRTSASVMPVAEAGAKIQAMLPMIAPGPQTSLGKSAMAAEVDEHGPVTLEDLMAQSAYYAEEQAKQAEVILAEIRKTPAAPAEPPAQQDHWAAAFGLTEEPAGLDVPLDVFTPEAAALYAVFHRSVINGSRTYPDARAVMLAEALALGIDIDAQGQQYLGLIVKWEVDRDVAIFALLTGLVDPYKGGFGARLERDVAALAGTYKPETLSDGTVVSRWIPLTFEGAYRKLLPSGSGGQAGQGGA